jgi:HSP20 family protein
MYRRYFRTPSFMREMDRLQREMDSLFERRYPRRHRMASGYPALNVWASEEGAVVTAELPGVEPDDIDISIVGDTLTLSGERQPDEPEEGVRYHRRERGLGRFSRSIQLPFNVDKEAVEATFDKGILHVKAPRAESDKPKKITVKSA